MSPRGQAARALAREMQQRPLREVGTSAWQQPIQPRVIGQDLAASRAGSSRSSLTPTIRSRAAAASGRSASAGVSIAV